MARVPYCCVSPDSNCVYQASQVVIRTLDSKRNCPPIMDVVLTHLGVRGIRLFSICDHNRYSMVRLSKSQGEDGEIETLRHVIRKRSFVTWLGAKPRDLPRPFRTCVPYSFMK